MVGEQRGCLQTSRHETYRQTNKHLNNSFFPWSIAVISSARFRKKGNYAQTLEVFYFQNVKSISTDHSPITGSLIYADDRQNLTFNRQESKKYEIFIESLHGDSFKYFVRLVNKTNPF